MTATSRENGRTNAPLAPRAPDPKPETAERIIVRPDQVFQRSQGQGGPRPKSGSSLQIVVLRMMLISLIALVMFLLAVTFLVFAATRLREASSRAASGGVEESQGRRPERA